MTLYRNAKYVEMEIVGNNTTNYYTKTINENIQNI